MRLSPGYASSSIEAQQSNPEKVAIVHGDTRFTYREFSEGVNRLANALKAMGVEKGDKMTFLCPNISPMLEAHYAVPMIGAVFCQYLRCNI